ncbi:MAG: penicillin acylase family protein [Proteobacteria bacterium]|nr:penicillin acylase family protein [Pseudomonadota bacterium]
MARKRKRKGQFGLQSRRRGFRWWWPFGGLGALVLLVIIVLAGGYIWLRGSLPEIDGEVQLAGLKGEVEVIRDAHAIPHIYAESVEDAAFAMGFVHAQDRLWQMEFQRRIGAGRLSELFGAESLGYDRFLRTLGVYRAAERTFENLDAETQDIFKAYAAGVNSFLASREGPLPLEFLLISHEPEPWRPADSIVWMKMMAWDLAGNALDEALRARMAKILNADQIAALWPGYPGDGPAVLESQALPDLPWEALAALLPPRPPEGLGSNNWVLSGEHTKSGSTLLANDPHLGLQIPSLWYLAHMSAPGMDVAGATLPGLPMPVLGRTPNFAWGFTNTNPDVQDLFIERLHPDDPHRYLVPGGSAPFETRQETIWVKDGKNVELSVRETRHGPIVSDTIRGSSEFLPTGHAVAFAWTALRDDDLSAQAATRIGLAEDWGSFTAVLRDFHAPQQNIVFADIHGNIGYIAPGRVPIRRSGNGWMPAKGWTGEQDWEGFIPYAGLPRLFNPRSGQIVTANNKVVGLHYPYFITRDWSPPHRAVRIEALLGGSDSHDKESFAAIQADTVSLAAKSLLPRLLTLVPPGSEAAQDALIRLAAWDHVMAAERAEPLIYMAWLRELMRVLFADELGATFRDYFTIRESAIFDALKPGGAWCDDTATASKEDCAAAVGTALDQALDYLASRYGENMDGWAWGEAHYAHSDHEVLGRVPLIGKLFEVQLANGGARNTVNAAGFTVRDEEEPFVQNHGPAYRAIYDLDPLGQSRFIQNTGQSGNPLSSHYRDFAEMWRDGEYVPLLMNRAEIESTNIGTLRLTPRQ